MKAERKAVPGATSHPGGNTVKHLLLAATVMITLTACENGIVDTSSTEQRIHWRITVGMSSGTVLDPLDGGDIDQVLGAEWINQDAAIRLEDALLMAEDIAAGLPDLIDLSISWISVPGYADGRPALSDDGCGGYVTTLLGALESRGLTYIVLGETTACEEVFIITMPEGEEVPVTVRVMEYYLRYIRPDVSNEAVSFIQLSEPRSDPPVRLEKRGHGIKK